MLIQIYKRWYFITQFAENQSNLGIHTNIFYARRVVQLHHGNTNKLFHHRTIHIAGAGDFNCLGNFILDILTPPIRTVKFLVAVDRNGCAHLGTFADANRHTAVCLVACGSNLLPRRFDSGHHKNLTVRMDGLIFGRGDRNRTCDPLHPMQVLYQAELHPERTQI